MMPDNIALLIVLRRIKDTLSVDGEGEIRVLLFIFRWLFLPSVTFGMTVLRMGLEMRPSAYDTRR